MVLTCQTRPRLDRMLLSQRPDHDPIWSATWRRDALITKTTPWPIQFETQHEWEMLLSQRLYHDLFNLKCKWRRDALIMKTAPLSIQFEVQQEGEMLLSRRSYHDPFNLKHNMKEICTYHEDHTMTHSIWSTTWMKYALITKTTPWPVQFEAPHEGEIYVMNVYHENLTPGYNHPW